MSKVLYATGLIEGGAEALGKTEVQGLTVNVVQSVNEMLIELEENSSEYTYCLMCVKSFYATGSRSEDEIFSELQMYVTQNRHIHFAFIDFDKQYQAKFNIILGPLDNIMYTNISKASIRLFNTLLERFLAGNQRMKPTATPSAKPDPPVRVATSKPSMPVRPTPAAPPPQPVKQEPVVEEYKVVEDNQVEQPQQPMPEEPIRQVTQQQQEPTQPPSKKPGLFGKLLGKPEKLNQPTQAIATPEQVQSQQIKVDTQKRAPVKNGYKALKGKSLLFTQASSCGATTVALMVSRHLAKMGLTVCYVEVSTTYASSNTIIDKEFFQLSGNNSRNNLDSFINGSIADVAECFEMCEDIHILRNNPTLIPAEWDVKVLAKRLPKMFDVVVYDVTMPVLRENPLFLLSCSYKFIVTTNDYSDVQKLAIELTRQYDDYYGQDNADLLCDTICKEFDVVVSHYVTCEGKSKRKLSWRDVLSSVVDSNEDLRDFESLEVVAVIPESISISANLFHPESLKHVVQILEGLK